MAIDNFIPAIWSARLLANLNNVHVYAQPGVINTDYEGEIRNVGDTVKINSIGRITIGNYSKNTSIGTPEVLDGAGQILEIDQSKYFNFMVDDVDAVQQTPKVMNAAMQEAGWGLNDVADQALAALHSEVSSDNYIGSEASPKTDLGTATTAYNYLVDLSVILDEDNVPSEGRWVIVPPWFHGVILKDSRWAGSGAEGADARLQNGMVGTAAGFRVLKSNNVASTTATTKFKIMAGHSIAWSFAEQIVKVEAYRPPDFFADAMKGLHVYGYKVTRPTAMAVLFASKP